MYGSVSACNHPSLVSKDYKIDREAAEPKASKDEGEDADDLAAAFGQIGISGGRKCQVCQTASVMKACSNFSSN